MAHSTNCTSCKTAQAVCNLAATDCCEDCRYGDTHGLYRVDPPPEPTITVKKAIEAAAAALFETSVPNGSWGQAAERQRHRFRGYVTPYIEGAARS